VTDARDNVYVLHRPHTVPEGRKPAPSVVVFSKDGDFIRAWGGPGGSGYDWPNAERNIFVDHNNFVWISGSSPSGQSPRPRESDDMLLKFTVEGRFVAQLGGRNTNLGSRDTRSVNKPGDLFVHAGTNEVFVADGYGNRRVIVFDADTLEYKRMWGAFGNMPEDRPGLDGGRGPNGQLLSVPDFDVQPPSGGSPEPLDTTGPGAMQFLYPVHSIAVSNDNIVYAADRSSRRIQEFTLQGIYNRQVFINRAGPASGSVCGFAFSPDPEQKYLYVADFGNSRIVVMDRKSLEILYQWGTRGATPGQFQGVHMIAVDSSHDLYAAEVAPGARLQKFAFKGFSSTLPPNALTAAQLAP
jgi:DNA-binding beta-propeller fold protein YncE